MEWKCNGKYLAEGDTVSQRVVGNQITANCAIQNCENENL